MLRRIAIGVIGAALLLGIVATVVMRIPAVQDAILRRGIARQLASASVDLLKDDALRVLLCGTSSPFPHRTRARPCVAVFAGGRFYVVDTGTGSWNNLALWRVPAERMGAVFLTHYHSDHIGELGEFNLQSWVAGRPGPLPVYGPTGVDRVVAGFNAAYDLDAGYRVAHHGADFLRPDARPMVAKTIALGSSGNPPINPEHAPSALEAVALEADGLVVTAFLVEHKPIEPAVGYRFDYRGRSAVVSGDTVKDQRLIEAAAGADVLVHEAQAQHMVAEIGRAAAAGGQARLAKLMGDIPSYHTSPVEAAEVANEARVRLLVLYHLTPPPQNRLIESVFVRGVDAVRPDDWMVGRDGLLIELPAGSDAVNTRNLE